MNGKNIKFVLGIIAGILIFVGIFVGVGIFANNEVTFKIYNWQGIHAKEQDSAIIFFQKASKAYPKWKLIAKNNELGVLYEQKKYDELNIQLQETIENECSLEKESISEFCKNIFYLNGLVQYRLGENKNVSEQKKYFEDAIYNFQKTLAIDNENTWAKENIEFILNKFASEQQTQQQEQDGGQGDQEQSKNSKEGQGQQDQEGQQEQGNQQEQNGEQQQDGDEQGDAEQKEGQNGNQQDGEGQEQSQDSRLPQQMQQELEQYQQELDQNQDSQGFNRSQSAAQKNNLKNQDPLEQMMNDPFFQQFFGNDPMMQNMMGEKNFTKDITNPNEKDW
jgi:hypothetical protein